MKRTIYILAICYFALSSCESKKEKLQGEWSSTYQFDYIEKEWPDINKIIFEDDSIFLNDYYQILHKFKFIIQNDSLIFDKFSAPIVFKDDSTIIINGTGYIKKGYEAYEENKLVDIELPNIESSTKIILDQNETFTQISIGKKTKDSTYNIVANTSYLSMNDFSYFFWCSGRQPEFLIISGDKKTPMSIVDSILCSAIIPLRIIFLTSCDFSNDIEGIYHHNMAKAYIESLYDPAPPLPPIFGIDSIIERKIEHKLLCVDSTGNYIFNDSRLIHNQISQTIKKEYLYSNELVLFITYDSSTKYENFLQVLDEAQNAISEIRNQESQKGFNSNYSNLSDSLRRLIKTKGRIIPMLQSKYDEIFKK